MHSNTEKTIIIGGGKACRLLLRNISSISQFDVLGIIDDNIAVHSLIEKRYPVLGTSKEVYRIAKQNNIRAIIIALPSERGTTIRRILLSLRLLPDITVYIIPRLPEIVVRDQIFAEDIRKIEPVDLIGGKIDIHSQTRVVKAVKNKTFLVTGAAGSIGSELSRQLFIDSPNKLILLDNSEKNLFYLKYHLSLVHPPISTKLQFVLGDVNNTALLSRIFKENDIDAVFHAAAYKHVPLLEENTYEAVQNNVLATFNVAKEAARHNISSFVLISTDKAVRPDSIMGMTKCVAEKTIRYFDCQSKTIFSAVRFGNVFNSNGSVVELFTKQIERQEALTITDPTMKRYFMSVSEAVHLILNAWTHIQKDRMYMFNMGSSVSIMDLTRCLLMINHKPADYPVKIIGKRKGEKTNEVLWDKQKEHRIDEVYDGVYAIEQKERCDKESFEDSLQKLLALLINDEVKNHSNTGAKKLKRALHRLCRAQ